MLARHLTPALHKAAVAYPVVTLTGPRQSGKTTLVRAEFADHFYVSLEAPDVRMQALEDPRSLLAQSDRMVIDEIQRAPDLLSYIQVLVDEDWRAGRFIVTGSHNLLLMKSVAQTLAGRTAVLTLHPLSLAELRGRENINAANLDRIDATGWAPPDESLWETLVTGFYPYIHDRQVDAGDRLIPVEVKSGSTVPTTACDTIRWWTSLPGNPNRGGVLVHGGQRTFDFKGVRVLPWSING